LTRYSVADEKFTEYIFTMFRLCAPFIALILHCWLIEVRLDTRFIFLALNEYTHTYPINWGIVLKRNLCCFSQEQSTLFFRRVLLQHGCC